MIVLSVSDINKTYGTDVILENILAVTKNAMKKSENFLVKWAGKACMIRWTKDSTLFYNKCTIRDI